MKIYVTFNNGQTTINAVNMFEACVKILQRFLAKKENSFDTNMPLNFRCSERGFDHDEKDDILIGIDKVIEYINEKRGETA